ncbi:ASCH domain-containing protein [Halobacteriovorax sp. GB3]|uniref:ASCH domain-containing protein n=1 Tax=Halobacteriovorax sp. GB3 TaxID=2719615 RepID=UPI0023608869|nr:ASCH domain-containing protein [Halobacteriovorax sp. GB3]MDD0851684.1 ASCH domain-containing protein [Halobacteriovorax sp. GB3]
MEDRVHEFWEEYLETLEARPARPNVEIGIAGNEAIADELLELYLSGKKTAGSGLVKDYELAGDELPKVGNYWIILNSKGEPKCIVKTIRVEFTRFDQVTEEIARAEGEGDLSIEHWRKAHVEFFTPYLKDWQISNLDEETLVTEFYEVVYK